MLAIATLDLDADLADQPTGLPASLRSATPLPLPMPLPMPDQDSLDVEAPPAPSRRVPDTYPPASTPLPRGPRNEPEDYAGPIRVQVPDPSLSVHELAEDPGPGSTPPPPMRDGRRLVPDQHREAWLLEQRAFVSWVRPIQDYLAKGVELLERIDHRDATRLREASASKAAESAALAARPRVFRLLDHPAVKPGLSLLTWLWGGLSGALLVGVLDYLGAETEPVTRFLLGWLGVLF